VKTIVDETSPCGFACQEVTVANGAEVRFRLAVTLAASDGPLTGTITVTDTLPSGLVPLLGTGATHFPRFSCTTSGQQVTCTLSAGWELMAPGDVNEIDIFARVGATAAGLDQIVTLTNTASASTPDEANTGDNTSAPVTVRVVGPRAPDVSIVKSVVDEGLPCGLACQEVTVANGAEVRFRLAVTLAPSSGPLTGIITVTDTLPSGLVPVLATGGNGSPRFLCTTNSQQITCITHSGWEFMSAGDVSEIEIVARVGANVAGVNQTVTLANIATAATAEDPNTTNNTSQPVFVHVNGPPAGAPTALGTNVPVQPTDANNVPQPITLTFAGVTRAGFTTAVPIVPPPAAPAGFQFRGTVYEISTTATVTPQIEVCFIGAGFSMADRIWHSGMVVPDPDHTVITSTRICATVNSLSPFGVVTRVNPVDQILALIDKTLALLNRPELKTAVRTWLQKAVTELVNNRPAAACGALNTYIALVKYTNALTPAQRAELVSDANRIKAVIGCS
jgi:hypothetical protein